MMTCQISDGSGILMRLHLFAQRHREGGGLGNYGRALGAIEPHAHAGDAEFWGDTCFVIAADGDGDFAHVGDSTGDASRSGMLLRSFVL